MSTPVGPTTSTPIVHVPIATLALPSLPDAVEIYEGHGPMHIWEHIAVSRTDEYEIEFARIGPLAIKVWVRRKSDGETVRTVVFHERELMITLANMALDSLREPERTGREGFEEHAERATDGPNLGLNPEEK